MAGRYTGSYLGRSNGWRAAAILADIGRASLVGRTPRTIMTIRGGRIHFFIRNFGDAPPTPLG
jgi:hypothetical protein